MPTQRQDLGSRTPALHRDTIAVASGAGRATIVRWAALPLLLVACGGSSPTGTHDTAAKTQDANAAAGSRAVSSPSSAPVAPPSVASATFTAEQIAAAEHSLGLAPLEGGLSSLEEIGQRVVDGLNAGDLKALEALLIGEREYKDRLFLTLANHPSALTFGADASWDMTARETRDELRRTLDRHGRKNLVFVGIEPPASESKRGLIVHRRPKLTVRTLDGETFDLAVLGSVIEHDATHTFKLLSYRDTPWRKRDAS